jgi:proteasome lid subunit RPN8/RPN11
MLKLSETAYSEIRKHGEKTYPHECCGILLGHAPDDANDEESEGRAGITRTDCAHNLSG